MRFVGHWTSATVLAVLTLGTSAVAQEIPSPLDRDTVVALAIERNPTIRAAHERALAAHRRADAEGTLPSPQIDLQVWQIPFSSAQGMLMAGVEQRFPALGSALGARAAAGHAEARAMDLASSDAERSIRRRAAHAFTDYAEANARMNVHAEHIELAKRIVAAAHARAEAGGPIADPAQADVELAMVTVDHDEARVKRRGAAAEIDALLLRPDDAPVPTPVIPAPVAPTWSLTQIIDEASKRRPEVAMARAEADADEARRVAAKREWLVPSLALGAFYFAPVGSSTQSGVGFSVSVEIPWLWGDKKAMADAAKLDASAALTRIAGTRVDTSAEIASAYREATAAALRVLLYDDQVVPASRRALDLVFAGYAAAKTELPSLLIAERALVDAELARVAAAAALEHALADLDAAAGFPVPRQPLAQWRQP